MSEHGNIPVLTDLIEKGIEIKMEELGLDDEVPFGATRPDENIDLEITATEVTGPDYDEDEADYDATIIPGSTEDLFAAHPALEPTIRRILDEHVELAWQEIRLAIQRELEKD